jgi:hypothetical protein
VAVRAQKQLDRSQRNLVSYSLDIFSVYVQAEYNIRILFQQYGLFSARFLRCILESIAILYEQMGRANEAENMYLRALYGLEAVLGRPS